MAGELEASVVIPTHNRAPLLDRVLASFVTQNADPSVFEVIVVDDGSTDDTSAVCRKYQQRLDLRYVPIARAGLPAAKNAGLTVARGQIVLFADDDDTADPELVAEHLRVHREAPSRTAVLRYGTWDPSLRVTDLMHFVTDIGQFLSAYRGLRHGDVLDFRYFWGGRVSVERDFIQESGGFDEQMAALEDVELGYRLSEKGLRVVFTRRAVNYMLRSFDYEGFCRRCERTGAALARFRALHPGPVVAQYGTVLLGPRVERLMAAAAHGDARMQAVAAAERRLEVLADEVLSLEQRLESGRLPASSPLARLSSTRRRLYKLYDESFRTATLKGALAVDERPP